MLSQRAKQICEFRKYTYYDIFCYSRKYNFRDGIKQTFQVLDNMIKTHFPEVYIINGIPFILPSIWISCRRVLHAVKTNPHT